MLDIPSGGDVEETVRRRGRAPPLDPFSGESGDITLDDWLPGLERVAEWNKWTDEEILIQLAGYLRGRPLQEWNLLGKEDKTSYKAAVEVLRERLGYGSRVLAAQDFRHTSQKEAEPVADFIRRLERSFAVAYGKDGMSEDTRSILLYGQLQEGLCYDVIKSSGVSGAQSYKELCLAARNEEKRQLELQKKQMYDSRGGKTSTGHGTTPPSYGRQKPEGRGASSSTGSDDRRAPKPWRGQGDRLCFVCRSPNHLERDCPKKSGESPGKQPSKPSSTTKRVHGDRHDTEQDGRECSEGLLDLLYSSDSDDPGRVKVVRVNDKGSKSQYMKLIVAGVPTTCRYHRYRIRSHHHGRYSVPKSCSCCSTQEAGFQEGRQATTQL